MYCQECGSLLQEGAKFCGSCGARVSEAPQESVSRKTIVSKKEDWSDPGSVKGGTKVTENIYLGTDGKYHWYYELSLFKNPVVLFIVCKIMFWIFFGIYLFMVCLVSCESHRDLGGEIWSITQSFGVFLCAMFVLILLSYSLYALMVGGHYCVLFEMDEKGVTHTQLPKQFKKANAMATVLMLAGAATGKIGRVGQGLIIKGHQSMSSGWNTVTSVEILRSQNTIKVNELLFKNQVYAADEDFDFVADFITSHVTDKCKIS